MKKLCILAFLCMTGCATVNIPDNIVYVDKGKMGAIKIHTMVDGVQAIDKATWDTMRLGMLCVTADIFAATKKEISLLCDYTGRCTFDTFAPFFKRIDDARLVSQAK